MNIYLKYIQLGKKKNVKNVNKDPHLLNQNDD